MTETTETTSPSPAVHEPRCEIFAAMAAAARELASGGVKKDSHNKQQNWPYRGIDAVCDVVGPALGRAGIALRCEYFDRNVVERKTQAGNVSFWCTVRGMFTFFAADGSFLTVGPFWGEAMDSGDKAGGKAESYAYRNALIKTFCIPVNGSGEDTDASTAEPVIPAAPKAPVQRTRETKPATATATPAKRAPAQIAAVGPIDVPAGMTAQERATELLSQSLISTLPTENAPAPVATAEEPAAPVATLPDRATEAQRAEMTTIARERGTTPHVVQAAARHLFDRPLQALTSAQYGVMIALVDRSVEPARVDALAMQLFSRTASDLSSEELAQLTAEVLS